MYLGLFLCFLKSLSILITGKDVMKTLGKTKTMPRHTGETLRAVMKGAQLPELLKETSENSQELSGVGKKEKQKNWNESGETEICLHCTFLLTIHIHLQQIHCLFLLCQVSFLNLPVLWGLVGKQPSFPVSKAFGILKRQNIKAPSSPVYLGSFNHNNLHGVWELLPQLSISFLFSLWGEKPKAPPSNLNVAEHFDESVLSQSIFLIPFSR